MGVWGHHRCWFFGQGRMWAFSSVNQELMERDFLSYLQVCSVSFFSLKICSTKQQPLRKCLWLLSLREFGLISKSFKFVLWSCFQAKVVSCSVFLQECSRRSRCRQLKCSEFLQEEVLVLDTTLLPHNLSCWHPLFFQGWVWLDRNHKV